MHKYRLWLYYSSTVQPITSKTITITSSTMHIERGTTFELSHCWAYINSHGSGEQHEQLGRHYQESVHSSGSISCPHSYSTAPNANTHQALRAAHSGSYLSLSKPFSSDREAKIWLHNGSSIWGPANWCSRVISFTAVLDQVVWAPSVYSGANGSHVTVCYQYHTRWWRTVV